MREELDAIPAFGAYELTEVPPDRGAIDTKWVYRVKQDVHGNISRYKARLVAKGFT